MTKLFLIFTMVFMATTSYAAPQNVVEVRASFAEAVNKVGPAVVNIFAQRVTQNRELHPFFADPFFSEFFGESLGTPVIKKRVEQSLGSGVIVSADGYFVTNNHVIEGASAMQVILADGREIEAEFVEADPSLDLAIMKLKLETDHQVPFAKLGHEGDLMVGDVVLAIGNPFGVGQSVSMGVVSALGRSALGVTPYATFIQTDAAINPGNSGGALVDSTGAVVGINTAIFSKSGASHGIGFAIPADVVNNVLTSVMTTGKIARPWLGATGQDLTQDLAYQLGVKSVGGVLINEVDATSPADKAGIKIGDVMLTLNNAPITNVRDLLAAVRLAPLNQPLPVKIWRQGQEGELTISMGTLPERRKSDQALIEGKNPLNGFVLEQLSPALNHELKAPLDRKGVIVLEAPQGDNMFAALNLRAGDVLESVNDKNVYTIKDVQKALAAKTRRWVLTYKRGNATYRAVIRK